MFSNMSTYSNIPTLYPLQTQPFFFKQRRIWRLGTWRAHRPLWPFRPSAEAAEGQEVMSALQHSIDRFVELAESEGASGVAR